jgi:hypothetical protein
MKDIGKRSLATSPENKIKNRTEFRRFVREVINYRINESPYKHGDPRILPQHSTAKHKKLNPKLKELLEFDQSYVAAGVYSKDEFSPSKTSGKPRRDFVKKHSKVISDAVKIQKQLAQERAVVIKKMSKKKHRSRSASKLKDPYNSGSALSNTQLPEPPALLEKD